MVIHRSPRRGLSYLFLPSPRPSSHHLVAGAEDNTGWLRRTTIIRRTSYHTFEYSPAPSLPLPSNNHRRDLISFYNLCLRKQIATEDRTKRRNKNIRRKESFSTVRGETSSLGTSRHPIHPFRHPTTVRQDEGYEREIAFYAQEKKSAL